MSEKQEIACGHAGILGGRRTDNAAALLSRGVIQRKMRTLFLGGNPKQVNICCRQLGLFDRTSDGPVMVRRWATDRVNLWVDGGGSGKIRSMGSCRGSEMTLPSNQQISLEKV